MNIFRIDSLNDYPNSNRKIENVFSVSVAMIRIICDERSEKITLALSYLIQFGIVVYFLISCK